MTGKAKNAPRVHTESTQVVDNIESTSLENAPRVQNIEFASAQELIGAIKHQKRLNQISEATLIIELAKVQTAYRIKANPHLTASAPSFKEFVENKCGLNYGTIRNKITHLNSIGPRMLQLFEQLGVPVTLQRQIKRLPANLRKRLDDALTGSPAESADEIAEVFRELTAHTITLQDKLDEADTKAKVDIIDERDRMKDHYELSEERMIHMSEREEKYKDQIKGLLASQKIDDKAAAVRKINDMLSISLKSLEDADLSSDDLNLQAEINKFMKLISRAHDMGLS